MKSCSVEGCGAQVVGGEGVCGQHAAAKVPASSPPRQPGQGAREIADELARQFPVRSFISKATFGIYMSPDYSWREGAYSEERVGDELKKLPRGWVVRHDIMIGEKWNADHVVVGPAGAFVLDTKFRTSEVRTTKKGIRVAGRKTNMAEKLQDQAREISARLRAAGMKSWVQPVLVFDNEVKGKREPDGVHVVGIDTVVEYLTTMPRELDDDEVQRLGRILLDDATWPFVRGPVAELAREEADGGGFKWPMLVAALVGVLAIVGFTGSMMNGSRPTTATAPKPQAKVTPAPTPPSAADATGERSPAVEAIRARYQAVGLAQRTLRKVAKDVLGMSTEGSTLVGYFEGPTLKKVEWTFLGESGQRLNEMTFHEGRLEFLFQKDVGGAPDGERRYYVADGKVVWATQGKDRAPMSANDIADAQNTVLELGVRALEALQAPGDKLLFGDGRFVGASN